MSCSFYFNSHDMERVLLKTELFIFPLTQIQQHMFATDQNSLPIFGCVFCRTHLILLLILSSPPSPTSPILYSEGHCRGPRVSLHVCHHAPLPTEGSLERASGSLVYIAFTFNCCHCEMS